jgi:mediator of RNA polymerase II transcription subunit 7
MSEVQGGSDAAEAIPAITNTLFPPPPAYFQAFTNENLNRYEQFGGPSRRRASANEGRQAEQGEEAGDQNQDDEELRRLRELLEPPRADWVREEGAWKCFGETRHVSTNIHATLLLSHFVV